MDIVLTIDNAEGMPDGVRQSFSVSNRSFEIGRDDSDWTLPDPNMFISGRHCEVRFDPASGYWLHDVSRNGTFLNGSTTRLSNPHLLQPGDRIRIGRYIVSVAMPAPRTPERLVASSIEDRPVPAPVGADQPRFEQPRSHQPRSDPFFDSDEGRIRHSGGGQTPAAAPPFTPPPARNPQPAPPLSADRQPSPRAPSPGNSSDILREIAAGAGISPDVFANRDSREVAGEIGAALRIVVEELAALLKARAAAKMLTKSGHQTMISSSGNNPLKFVPGAEEMLEKMFARRTPGYLDAKASLEDAFKDLKTHEVATYAAMQKALSRLMEELSPETIERKVPPSSFGSKRGKSWDAFVKAWESREQAHENGMLDVFLAYFSESYAAASKQK